MSFKLRLTLFFSTIVAALVFMVFLAFRSWGKADQFAGQLKSVQLDSFKTAHEFRADLEQLDYYLLQFGVRHYKADWERFATESRKLDRWIDEQRPKLSTQEEKSALDDINKAYDDYLAAARSLHNQVDTSSDTNSVYGQAFELIELRSRRLVDLAFQLVSLHRLSIARFNEVSSSSLLELRTGLFTALGVLLLTGLALARMVYLDLVAPLRAELSQSKAIIERQEKLVSLGVLATGVAHEIRNPLTAIKALLFRHQRGFTPSSKEFAQVSAIDAEINRLENIVKQTLEFARPADPVIEVHPVRPLLMECAALLAPELAAREVEVAVEDGPNLSAAFDQDQMKQVIINLVRNAGDSIAGVGKVLLRALKTQDGDREMICLEVSDTGAGIPPDVQKRLFDPFFTTKASGTGLGLAIAARLVQGHGGVIGFRTQLQKGTVFNVLLPVSKS